MAWPNKKTTEEMFGMSEEELKSMVTGSKELPAKITDLESKMATKEDITAINTTLSSLNETLAKISAPASKGGGSESNSTEGENKLTEWNDDPDLAFRERQRPVVGLALTSQAMVLRQDTFSDTEKYKYYPILKAKVDALIKEQPLELQINPKVLENCYKVVLADHIEDIKTDNSKKEGRFYLEGAGKGNSTPTNIPDKDDVSSLTDKELKAAKTMRITPEEYLKTKKGMIYV